MSRGPTPKSVADRFWPKVQKTETCWIWTGSKSRGLGMIAMRPGDPEHARRVAWRLQHGPIPPTFNIIVECDNALCMRGNHLRCVPPAEKTAIQRDRGRARGGSSPGEKNPNRRLSADGANAIRAAEGRQWDIADAYGVSQATVSCIKLGKTWKQQLQEK